MGADSQTNDFLATLGYRASYQSFVADYFPDIDKFLAPLFSGEKPPERSVAERVLASLAGEKSLLDTMLSRLLEGEGLAYIEQRIICPNAPDQQAITKHVAMSWFSWAAFYDEPFRGLEHAWRSFATWNENSLVAYALAPCDVCHPVGERWLTRLKRRAKSQVRPCVMCGGSSSFLHERDVTLLPESRHTRTGSDELVFFSQ